jgi:hypothetical protein
LVHHLLMTSFSSSAASAILASPLPRLISLHLARYPVSFSATHPTPKDIAATILSLIASSRRNTFTLMRCSFLFSRYPPPSLRRRSSPRRRAQTALGPSPQVGLVQLSGRPWLWRSVERLGTCCDLLRSRPLIARPPGV